MIQSASKTNGLTVYLLGSKGGYKTYRRLNQPQIRHPRQCKGKARVYLIDRK